MERSFRAVFVGVSEAPPVSVGCERPMEEDGKGVLYAVDQRPCCPCNEQGAAEIKGAEPEVRRPCLWPPTRSSHQEGQAPAGFGRRWWRRWTTEEEGQAFWQRATQDP